MTHPVDSNEQQFDPVEYLQHYYQVVDRENDILLDFMVRVTSAHDLRGATVLDFGCGPTIYAMISLARTCSVIDMSDYLPANLEQISRWLANDHRAFDWMAFIRRTLELEDSLERAVGAESYAIGPAQIEARAALIRRKVRQLVLGDARQAAPLGPQATGRYDVVVSAFCLEAVAENSRHWKQLVANLATLLKPAGLLVMATIVDSAAYRIAENELPLSLVSQQDCWDALSAAGFVDESIMVDLVAATDPNTNLYSGAILSSARKR